MDRSTKLAVVERIEELLTQGFSHAHIVRELRAPKKLVASVAEGTWETRQILAAAHGQPSALQEKRCGGCGHKVYGRRCLICRDRGLIARHGPPVNGSPALKAIPLRLEPEARQRYLDVRRALEAAGVTLPPIQQPDQETIAMATALRKRKSLSDREKPAAAAEGPTINGHGELGALARSPGEFQLLPIEAIRPSPTNPRKEFDPEELQKLAASIRAVGVLQPLIVQARSEGHYELVAGERRLRAAKLAGLERVPCSVREFSPAQFLVVQTIENLQRKDLNALEEAQAFALLCAPIELGGGGFTQKGLSDELGCTPAHVSNRIRLLELPDWWRKKMLDGELPASHGRALLRAKDVPAALDAMKSYLDQQGQHQEWEDWPCTVERWEHYLDSELEDATRPMEGTVRSNKTWREEPIFAPSDEQTAELQIVEVVIEGKTHRMATNAELWDKLQEEHVAAIEAKREKRAAGKTAGGTTSGGSAGGDREPTAAEKRAKAKQQAEQFARRLRAWKLDWLRVECGQKLAAMSAGDGERVPWQVIKLLLFFATERAPASYVEEFERVDDLAAAVGQPKKKKRGCGLHEDNTWKLLDGVKAPRWRQVALELLSRWFVDEEGHARQMLPDGCVEGLAEDLAIDVPECWRAMVDNGSAESERLQEYFHLHTKDQLLELGQELGLKSEDLAGSKSEMVDVFMHAEKLKLPKELK